MLLNEDPTCSVMNPEVNVEHIRNTLLEEFEMITKQIQSNYLEHVRNGMDSRK